MTEPRGPEAPRIPLTRDRPARPTLADDMPVRCPLCHGIERAGDIVGGVCLTCAEGITWAQNARRGAIGVPDLGHTEMRETPQAKVVDLIPPDMGPPSRFDGADFCRVCHLEVIYAWRDGVGVWRHVVEPAGHPSSPGGGFGDFGDYGEQLVARGGVIDPKIERQIMGEPERPHGRSHLAEAAPFALYTLLVGSLTVTWWLLIDRTSPPWDIVIRAAVVLGAIMTLVGLALVLLVATDRDA